MNIQAITWSQKQRNTIGVGLRAVSVWLQKRRMSRDAKWFVKTYGDTIKKLSKE